MKKKLKAFRKRPLYLILALIMFIAAAPMLSEKAYAESAPQPDYNGKFTVYSTYFNYYPFRGGNMSAVSAVFRAKYSLYMEYSTNGKTWKRSGRMQGNLVQSLYSQGYRIGGLKPNTKYKTRIYYGDDYGKRLSPYRNTGTIKTGQKSRPVIKKVTAKAVNVKYHKTTRSGYWYWTGYSYIWTRPVKMKYYTYNVKVTVELKKKPGTGGIWVNGRWLKGNKKKYTTTFKLVHPWNMSVKKPKGNVKYTVSVQTGQAKSYGGYSPTWKKKLKLK